MSLSLTDEQTSLVRTVREFCARECTSEIQRDIIAKTYGL
jgi:hypothetical protein